MDFFRLLKLAWITALVFFYFLHMPLSNLEKRFKHMHLNSDILEQGGEYYEES